MINKINLIKGVGKIKHSSPSNISLNENVLIYGKNTHGKSTFTSIFNSIKKNNPDLMIGRKSFGFKGKQEICIDIGGENYKFDGEKWDKNFQNLEIFDNEFVTENVCDFRSISNEQQKNLNNIILGSRGSQLVYGIGSLSKEIERLGNEKKDLTLRYFNPLIEGLISLEDFLSMEKKNGVDRLISEKEKEIKQIENKQEIIKKIENSFFNNFDFSKFEEALIKKIEDVKSEDISEHLKKHFESEEEGKEFIQKGLKNKDQNSCPFCGQEFNQSAMALLEKYRKIFTKKFEEIQREIVKNADEFLKTDFFNKISSEDLKFKEYGLEMPLDDDKKQKIRKAKEELNKTFEDKKINISKPLDLREDENWVYIKDIFKEISDFLNSKKKEYGQEKNLTNEKKELEKLKINKKRFLGEIAKKVKEYNGKSSEQEKLHKKREDKRKELDEYARDIFSKYKNQINYFLNELGSDFQIDEFEHLKKIKGNDESLFFFCFDQDVKFSPYERDNSSYCFNNTLSESDRSTLALAFFLAKLSLDDNLHEKVVIFDDPLSSFDTERKRKTLQFLLNIKNEMKHPKQIIILTHHEDFLRELHGKLKNLEKKYVLLKIYEGEISLVHDIEKEFPLDEITYNLESLKKMYEEGKVESDYATKCRIVLENIMKRKYYIRLQSLRSQNPGASIRAFADELYKTTDPKFHELFISFCDDIQIPLHDNSVPSPSKGDKESILKDFFEILEKI